MGFQLEGKGKVDVNLYSASS